MAGRPAFDGAVQLTSRLVADPGVADTEGAAGATGGSFTSVIPIVTAMVSVSPLPSSAFTVTA